MGVYRRILGIISILASIVMAALSGLSWYNPDSSVIWAIMSLGAALLGIGLIKDTKIAK